MKYRSDIDGLRAIAVLSVIGFHYFPPVLPGGFIGVDIFFVISGYLISGVIFSEIDGVGFSIINFYRRRINRIFPALCIVLIASLIFGWISLYPDEYKSLGNNTFASSIFLENIYLLMQSGYFDADASTKPLLHIWSLGVEEQFYIIYPPMLILAQKFRLLNARFLALCCGLSFIISLIVIIYSKTADFYIPITRFWELSVGGILAWTERTGSREITLFKWVRSLPVALISCAGLLAIVAGFFLIDARTPFPGFAAVVPVLGAALIIGAGPANRLTRFLLSNPLAVFVGKISYPLYLWHWPLLAFLYIVNIEKPEPPVRLVLLVTAFALATATWLVLETPIRRRYNNSWTAIILLVIMGSIGATGWTVAHNSRLNDDRAVNRINAGVAVKATGIESPPLPVHNCSVPEDVARQFRNCIQDRNARARFVLLGDSKADALYRSVMRSSLPGGRWLYLGGADATTFGAPFPMLSANPAWANVQPQSRAAINYIVGDKDLHVVLYAVALRNIYRLDDNGGAGRLFNSYDFRFLARLRGNALAGQAQAAVMEAVGRLVAADKTVAILVDNPPLPPLRSCNGRLTASEPVNHLLGLRNGNSTPSCLYSKARFREDARTYFDMLNKVKAAYRDKVIIMDYTDFYCQEMGGKACGTSYSGNAIYGYTDHISSFTAAIVGRSINQRLRSFDAR